MTQPSQPNSASPDPLDRLLAEFFQSQLKHPWPAAPRVAQVEPATLLAARNQPAVATRRPVGSDSSNRARLTLAASVAVLLGSCWYLSNGFQPTAVPGGVVNPQAGAPVINLNNGTADGKMGLPGELAKEKAKKAADANGFKPGPMNLP